MQRFPTEYAVETLIGTGPWATIETGVIHVGAADGQVLDAFVASIAFAQLAAATAADAVIRVSAETVPESGAPLWAYRTAARTCGIIESFEGLGTLLERAAEARGGYSL